jgi:hypothetical protein
MKIDKLLLGLGLNSLFCGVIGIVLSSINKVSSQFIFFIPIFNLIVGIIIICGSIDNEVKK